MKSVITSTIEQTTQLAKSFVQTEIDGGTIICLQGELGAGKTTFAQGILAACDATGPYISPTFNIVKEYEVDIKNIKKIYHIDAYRIGNDDMESIGWRDIINNKNAIVIIEWPENISKVLPQNIVMILCEWVSETQRKYTFK